MKIDEKSEGHISAVARLIADAAKGRKLKKAVLSKSDDPGIRRAEIKHILLSGRDALQCESFLGDNKAVHKNIPLENAHEELCQLIGRFAQVNVITAAGECEYRRSKSGNEVVLGLEKLLRAMEGCSGGEIPGRNNREKNYILEGNEPFLVYLGVSSREGRVYDKKQSKFRQINRFLEHIRDIEDYLPTDKIRICDLCCGKSYLSFAVYHYFCEIRKMKVSMTGVDLKPDVVDFCNETAKALGYSGLEFVCGDIKKYETNEPPQLVVSLHACDTATDIVLEKAASWEAKVILSTPCCHHELNHKINCPELEFITDHSMLRQKLCDAATDAMRLKLLESKGYRTAALELIDPDETPKNILLRAIRKENFDPDGHTTKKLAEEYDSIRKFLMRDFTERTELHENT